jgi:hypothetical protein
MEKVDEFLAGYALQEVIAKESRVSKRTLARYRNQPNGLPYMEWGGKIYIPRDEGREYLRSRIKRPNQRRRSA